MTSIAAVAIVGAGPYGLSIAAHLAARQLEPLVFGSPMESWRNGMPRGMRLKSEGFATCLSDPEGLFTLKTFCEEESLPYADLGLPVPVETFVAYGEAFQKRFVPQVDARLVQHIRRAPHGFTLRLEDGTRVDARQVIVATGIGHFRHIPEVLSGLSSARVSHTCEHADYSAFSGRRVTVVGAGASAIDAAAALRRAGASVRLVSRRAAVTFYAGGGPRQILDRLIAPMTPLGPGWKKLFCVKAPLLFRALPERLRTTIVRRYLGPAPGYSAREDFEGKVSLQLSSTLVGARETAEGVELEIEGPDGRRSVKKADHVVAGTGYCVDVGRLAFLDPELVAGIAMTQTAPRLSSRFESKVRGLYFVGTAAAFEFGPMLRFVCGAGFTAHRVASHVAFVERRRLRAASPRFWPSARSWITRSGRPLDLETAGESRPRLEGTPIC